MATILYDNYAQLLATGDTIVNWMVSLNNIGFLFVVIVIGLVREQYLNGGCINIQTG